MRPPVAKRKDLIHRIADAAKVAGLDWYLQREGGFHQVCRLDGLPVIPHAKINGLTAAGISRKCAGGLGRDWSELTTTITPGSNLRAGTGLSGSRNCSP